MKRMTDNKIVLVIRPTRLDELVQRFNTVEQARFYIEHGGANFSDYMNEHELYRSALTQATSHLEALGRVQILDRHFLSNFIFDDGCYVVVLGQDGLVANTIKYLNGQPVIGVNPDPERWDGILLPFVVEDLPKIVLDIFAGRRSSQSVNMAMAKMNNGQKLYAVNDLFIGPKSHTSIRYSIQSGEKSEPHSSSGIIVSTGVGSTGWFKSLMTGAQAIVSSLVKGRIPIDDPSGFPWDADYLYYTVREPFLSQHSSASLVFGKVTEEQPLLLESHMPQHGIIFSDGIESDYLQFNSGTRATITPADKQGVLVA